MKTILKICAFILGTASLVLTSTVVLVASQSLPETFSKSAPIYILIFGFVVLVLGCIGLSTVMEA